MANETLISYLSSFFSLLALSLAAIGLYGVMTYNVLRRATEIGIRMALGAPSREVLWMILQEALVLLTVGVAIGIPATLGATHFIQSQLFGLGPSDPLALGAAILVITAVTLISAYFPARRATRVDPMMALRYQ
jgi:ABC-type antimicrobial peptide transport system permease subunit